MHILDFTLGGKKRQTWNIPFQKLSKVWNGS